MLFGDLLPKNYFLNIIFFLGISGVFLGLAIFVSKPFFPIYQNQNTSQTILALDTSISMNSDDVYPSRIGLVKKGLQDFLSKNHSSDIGIVVFAGRAYISLPATSDMELVKNYIQNLKTFEETNQNLQGTAIGDAILSSMKMLSGEKKNIILITDGQSNKGISQKTAYEYAFSSGANIFMIGVGSKNGSYLKIGDTVQKIDGVDLKNFEGKKFEVQSSEDFENALQNIFSTFSNEKKTTIEKQYIDPKLILFFSSFFLLLVHLLSQSKFARD